MALVVLITAILVSALVVKVGTVALTMTGLDRRKAAFQSQSAFTNTGWTTRETELIMAHDQRRRIVGAMMVLGYAGFASVVATLIASLGQRGVTGFFRSLAILAIGVLFIYLLARWRGLDRRLTAEIEKRLRQTTDLRGVSFEEVLFLAEGYGVAEVYVFEGSDIAHKSIGQSRLRARGMAVLAVDRAGEIIPAPDAETLLLPGDRLICYGKVKSIEDIADEKAPTQTDEEAVSSAQTRRDTHAS
jgi:hypothetical protein